MIHADVSGDSSGDLRLGDRLSDKLAITATHSIRDGNVTQTRTKRHNC